MTMITTRTGLAAGAGLALAAGTTNADIIWMDDMMDDLEVFPHNASNRSPLIVGDLISGTSPARASGVGRTPGHLLEPEWHSLVRTVDPNCLAPRFRSSYRSPFQPSAPFA